MYVVANMDAWYDSSRGGSGNVPLVVDFANRRIKFLLSHYGYKKDTGEYKSKIQTILSISE